MTYNYPHLKAEYINGRLELHVIPTSHSKKDIIDKYRMGQHSFEQLAFEYNLPLSKIVSIWEEA